MRTLLAAALLVLAGCTPDGVGPVPARPTTGPAGATSSVSAAPPATDEAEGRDRVLARLAVTRRGDRLSFRALWTWGPGRRHQELVLGDGARRDRVPAPAGRDLRAAFPAPPVPGPLEASRVFARLLPLEVPSLRRGTRVVIGGGDGATLLPFQRLAVSEDWDDWSITPLPLFDGERAYVSGAVTLRDGRLVALLDHFSDDRPGQPGDRHHGLWASERGDLLRYTPYRPRFVPPLRRPPDGWGALVSLDAARTPDPVVWATTWDHRLYVSTGAMRTFREVDAR